MTALSQNASAGQTRRTRTDNSDLLGRLCFFGHQFGFITGKGIDQASTDLQFKYMVEWGMTPMEAIQSATSVAARYMDWEDRVGAVSPGLFGDLVAVRGDPLQDISILEQVDAVVKGGLVFKAPAGTTR